MPLCPFSVGLFLSWDFLVRVHEYETNIQVGVLSLDSSHLSDVPWPEVTLGFDDDPVW